MTDVQNFGEEFQRVGKDGFETSVRLFGEVSKGFQAIAQEGRLNGLSFHVLRKDPGYNVGSFFSCNSQLCSDCSCSLRARVKMPLTAKVIFEGHATHSLRSNEPKDAGTNLHRPRNALELNAYCDHAREAAKAAE